MGKIKRRRLRASRYSPTYVYSNGKNQENSYDTSYSKISHSNVAEGSEYLDTQPSLSYASVHPNNENFKIDHLERIKGGLKTAQEKIQCHVPEERMTGLNMLAAFALECKAADNIVERKLTTLITPLLKDPNTQVRLAAIGALRNISALGSDDIIDMIIQQDVLQPLSQLLKTYESNMPPMDGSQANSLMFTKGVANTTDVSDPHHLIFIHATNVMLSLCESSEEAIQVFNREGLIDVLLKHISPDEWGYSVALSVADCLLCVSENNPKIFSSILPVAESLFSLVSKSLSDTSDAFGLHFATVITGVLLNISYWDPGDASFRLVFEVLNQVLEVDAASLCQTTLRDSILRVSAIEQTEHTVAAQLIAFEILSNICCPDGEAEWDECDDDDEEQHQMERDESMEAEDEADTVHTPDSLSPELVERTRGKIVLPSLKDFSKNEEENKRILDKFGQLQIRALQCFQNLVDCQLVEALGGSDNLHSIWLDLGQLFSASSNADTRLLEATSGAMRAVTTKLNESDCQQICNFSQNDLKLIFDAGLLCEAASVRANLCRMVGSLGCAFNKDAPENCLASAEPYDRLSSLVDFLLQVSRADPTLWVRAEALDVLIDLFSDDKTDGLAARVRLVDRLKEIQPQFKYNQQRKTLSDHRPLVLTVRDNLMAFIKYKGSRASRLARIGQ